jgi:hypothetical protein
MMHSVLLPLRTWMHLASTAKLRHSHKLVGSDRHTGLGPTVLHNCRTAIDRDRPSRGTPAVLTLPGNCVATQHANLFQSERALAPADAHRALPSVTPPPPARLHRQRP